MPVVVADSSVLISLAAGEQFSLLHDFYSVIFIPPEVWNEVVSSPKPFGAKEVRQAQMAGWLVIQKPKEMSKVMSLPFALQAGETEALALAMQFQDPLLLVDDAQGRRAAQVLCIAYTGTLGVLLRAKKEGKIAELRSVLTLVMRRTHFWLGEDVYKAALQKAGELNS